MQKTLAIIGIVLLAISGAVLGWWLRGLTQPKPVEPVIQKDTLYLRDTVEVDRPIPQPYPVYLPSDTVRLVTTQHDTVEVMVPMEQKHYSDSLYDAYVSGFKPSLDSLRIYQTTKVVTITEIVKVPEKKRWGIGVQAGMGVQYGTIHKQMDVGPYIGVGISYNILSF